MIKLVSESSLCSGSNETHRRGNADDSVRHGMSLHWTYPNKPTISEDSETSSSSSSSTCDRSQSPVDDLSLDSPKADLRHDAMCMPETSHADFHQESLGLQLIDNAKVSGTHATFRDHPGSMSMLSEVMEAPEAGNVLQEETTDSSEAPQPNPQSPSRRTIFTMRHTDMQYPLNAYFWSDPDDMTYPEFDTLPLRTLCSHDDEDSPPPAPLESVTDNAAESHSISHCIKRSSLQGLPRKPSLKGLSSVSSSCSFRSLRPSVSFSNLEIREYDIALSDHPSCSYGPPIQLGWDYNNETVVPLEDYEQQRSPRRSPHQLVLSYRVRRHLLSRSYSKTELQDAVNEVERVKRQRMVTDMWSPVQHVEEVFEHFVHYMRRVMDCCNPTRQSRERENHDDE